MTPYTPPSLHEVRIEYRLVTPSGRTPDTQSKRWFFEVPPGPSSRASWLELVNRIFYDANVALQRREPSDPAWFFADQVRVGHVDVDAALAWNGHKSLEAGLAHLPWMVSEGRVVWEPAACFIVDPARRYAPVSAAVYTQLLAYRAREISRLDDAGLERFLEKLNPGEGAVRAGPWKIRLDALAVVPPTPKGIFRRQPQDALGSSGPPSPFDVHDWL